MSVQSMGEMGKKFCPNLIQPFLETIDRRSRNEGSRELILVFHHPQRKGRLSVGMPSKTPLKTPKYLECNNEISSKSSPLQGMKAQPLQSLYAGKATNVSYQPRS